MPTRLYCLIDATSDLHPPTEFPGVRVLVIGRVAAWVATVERAEVHRDARRAAREVVEHDRVIAHAVSRGLNAVPATLADAYQSDDAAAADISERTPEIVNAMARTDGSVEMALVVIPDTPAFAVPADSRGPGRAYMERLRSLPATLTDVADDLDRRVGPLALATARRVDRDRVGVSHLVRLADVSAYRQAVADVNGRFRLIVDGPRAVYSFAAFSPRPGSGSVAPETRHETGRLGREK
jgi:hypothetical protein